MLMSYWNAQRQNSDLYMCIKKCMVEWTLLLYKYVTWISIFFCYDDVVSRHIQIMLDLFIFFCIYDENNDCVWCRNNNNNKRHIIHRERACIEIHNNIFQHFDLRGVRIKQCLYRCEHQRNMFVLRRYVIVFKCIFSLK